MIIKILGTGCSKCKTLEKLTNETVDKMGITVDVIKEEDIKNIMKYGVMSTPALVINEKVVVSGRVPSAKEIEELINKNKN